MLESLSESDRNAGFGVFRSAYVVGGSTGSIGVVAFTDFMGWYDPFILLAVLFSIAFAMVLLNRAFRFEY